MAAVMTQNATTTATLTVVLKQNDALTFLLQQPNELIGEVVQWLDIKDLLNLRRTCRSLHELIHSHEESICARYRRTLGREHAVFDLPDRVFIRRNDLTYYIELQHRYESMRLLSLTLAEHVSAGLRQSSPQLGKEDEDAWRQRKGRKLHKAIFPWLFALNSFFECLGSVFAVGEESFASLDNETYLALRDVYDLDQQQLIENSSAYQHQAIDEMSSVFSVLKGVMRAKKLSLNSKSHKYPFASVKRMLLQFGLMPLGSFVRPEIDDAERRILLVSVNERTMTARAFVDHRADMTSIHHLDTERLTQTTLHSFRRLDVRNSFMDRQDIWSRASIAVMQREGMTDLLSPEPEKWLREHMAESNDINFDMGSWATPVG